VYNKVNRIQMHVLLLIVFFLQSTLLDLIKIYNTKPDLGAMFIIFIAIFFGWDTGLEAGFVFGLLKDIYSVDIFGINTATLAFTGLAAGLLSPKLFRESRITQFLVVFIFTLFYFITHYLVSQTILNINYISFSEYLLSSFIPVSLYTALVANFIFPFFINRFDLKENTEYL